MYLPNAINVHLFFKFFVIKFFDNNTTVDVLVIKPIKPMRNIYGNEILVKIS
jgi:hypothetical protein